MSIELDASLQRWTEAQLIEPQQADRIRAFEAAQAPARRARWPVVVALAFGGVMLAAGVLLFASAHWDKLSRFQRTGLLVGAVAGFHAAGAYSRKRFRALGITLQAAGTASLGGALILAGQMFDMREHWPTAILLWAVGAIAGWLVLGDWPQLALAAILTPWGLAAEWSDAMTSSSVSFRVVAAGCLLLAICYLSVRSDRDHPARLSLAWLGGLALLPAAFAVALGRVTWSHPLATDPMLTAIGWGGAILIPLAFAFAFRRREAWMNVVAAVWVTGLSWIADQQLETLLYAWCAAGSVAMIAWGIYEFRPERINLGMAGFALTIIFFFFSSVMDKLGRSASLMALGILFVAGGWQWEKLRRRLVTQVQRGTAP